MPRISRRENAFVAHIVAWHDNVRMNALRDFARALKIKPPRVSSWVSGRTWPEEDIAPQVCELLKIAPDKLQALRPGAETSTLRDAGPGYSSAASDRLGMLERQVLALQAKVAELEERLPPRLGGGAWPVTGKTEELPPRPRSRPGSQPPRHKSAETQSHAPRRRERPE